MQESVLGQETRREMGSHKPWGATGEGWIPAFTFFSIKRWM